MILKFILILFISSVTTRDYKMTGNFGGSEVRIIHEYTDDVPKEFSTVCDLSEPDTRTLCGEIVGLELYSDLNMTEESVEICAKRLAIFPFGDEGHVKVNISARRCPISRPIRLWISQGNENDNGTIFVYQQFSVEGPIHFDTCLTGFQKVNVFQLPKE